MAELDDKAGREGTPVKSMHGLALHIIFTVRMCMLYVHYMKSKRDVSIKFWDIFVSSYLKPFFPFPFKETAGNVF